jgi:hypothetical protein
MRDQVRDRFRVMRRDTPEQCRTKHLLALTCWLGTAYGARPFLSVLQPKVLAQVLPVAGDCELKCVCGSRFCLSARKTRSREQWIGEFSAISTCCEALKSVGELV